MGVVEVQQVDDGITKVTMNRPERLNAMNSELIESLHETLGSIGRDKSTRVVILSGAGRGFCAGLDLTGYGTPPGVDDEGRVARGMATQQHIASLVPRLRSLRQPVISAVNGAASGGGMALALASDVRIGAQSARFNVAFVKIGLSGCDIGVSWLLPRLIGSGPAFELLLTGRIVEADEALRIGLLSRIVPDDELLDSALETARQIRANSPIGVWMTKEVMWSNLEVGSLQAGIDLENRTQIMTTMTDDHREAMMSFLEKRDPTFRYG